MTEPSSSSAEGTQATEGTATPAEGTAPETQSTNGDSPPWYSGLNEDNRGWVELKGFKDADSALASHRQLEQKMGYPNDRLLVIPKDDASPQEWADFNRKLGVPGEAGEYGFKELVPESQATPVDQTLVEKAQEWMLEEGIPKEKGKAIARRFTEFASELQQQQAEALEAQHSQEFQALDEKWQKATELNVKVAKHAFQEIQEHLGLDVESGQAFEQALYNAIGPGKTLEMFQFFGEKLGEHQFKGPEGTALPTGFHLSPAAAKAKEAELMSNPDYKSAYLAGDKAKIKEINNLHKIMSGED